MCLQACCSLYHGLVTVFNSDDWNDWNVETSKDLWLHLETTKDHHLLLLLNTVNLLPVYYQSITCMQRTTGL